MKRTPLKKVSTKRRKENAEYLKLREAFLVVHPLCQCCRAFRTTQIHHKGRRHGKWLLMQEHWMAVCSVCHDRIERNGEWARENGFLLTPEERRKVEESR